MKAIIIVIDGFGIGEMPDAGLYNDSGSNTLKNVMSSYDINLPVLASLGLFNIEGINMCREDVEASYGRMRELSQAKDTTAGHWEISGVITKKAMPTFPNGFDSKFIAKLCKALGVEKVLLNKAYSGTDAIRDFGDEHIATGYPIVYTSADSVLQIAAHTDIVSLEQLYKWCELARGLCVGDYAVGRVIARPFYGVSGNYQRAMERKDFSLNPPHKTVLNQMAELGYSVVSVGKIEDIFNNSGLTESYHTHTNLEGLNMTIKLAKKDFDGLVFVNLVDTDMKFGHRRDIVGYAQALEEIDSKLADLIKVMDAEDVLYITSDHGCDPTHTRHTDHTREYTPLVIFGDEIGSVNLGTLVGFDTIADTIREQFNMEHTGKSVWKTIVKEQ